MHSTVHNHTIEQGAEDPNPAGRPFEVRLDDGQDVTILSMSRSGFPSPDPEDARSQFSITPSSIHKGSLDATSYSGDIQRQLETVSRVVKAFESEYGHLGVLTKVKQLTGGVINESFLMTVKEAAGGEATYFARLCQPEKSEKWIQFEQEVLSHLERKGFHWSASLVPSQSGAGYIQVKDAANSERFFMVTSALKGDSPYDHENNALSQSELESVAHVFGRFHNTVSSLTSKRYSEDYVPKEARMLRKLFNKRLGEADDLLKDLHDSDSAFAREIPTAWEPVLEILQDLKDTFKAKTYKKLPHLAIHHDLHPGNLMFQNGVVSGLFDLDFTRPDARAYDVGLSCVFFCAMQSENDQLTGKIDLERLTQFIRAYQSPENFVHGGHIAALTDKEIEVLPHMMQLAAGMLSHWFIKDFHERVSDTERGQSAEVDREWTDCAKFRMGTVAWIEKDMDAIKATLKAAQFPIVRDIAGADIRTVQTASDAWYEGATLGSRMA